MYVFLVLSAIFQPHRVSRRIKCPHEKLKSHMIDGGMRKRYWCISCDASWASGGLAS